MHCNGTVINLFRILEALMHFPDFQITLVTSASLGGPGSQNLRICILSHLCRSQPGSLALARGVGCECGPQPVLEERTAVTVTHGPSLRSGSKNGVSAHLLNSHRGPDSDPSVLQTFGSFHSHHSTTIEVTFDVSHGTVEACRGQVTCPKSR